MVERLSGTREPSRRIRSRPLGTASARRSLSHNCPTVSDIEWSLGQLEGIAAPVPREFEERWPLDDDDKQQLAEPSRSSCSEVLATRPRPSTRR
jgi:hypothetical protein